MGSIRARPGSGCLYFDFRYRGIRCRELTALPATKANEQRLKKILRDIERDIAAGRFSYRAHFPSSKRADFFEPAGTTVAVPTAEEVVRAASEAAMVMRQAVAPVAVPIAATPLFTDFADKWYDEREVDWKRSTRLKVADILRKHLNPRFKGRRVGEITKEDILSLRNYLDKEYRDGRGLSNSRINGVLNVLRQVLDEAGDRYGFGSPYRKIKPLHVGKTRIDPFSLEEVQKILTNVPAAHEPLYTVAFFTAMRTSELLGLKWDAVDFARSQILVRETWVCGGLDTPKTDGSDRVIDMSTPVRAALERQRQLTAAVSSEFVFCATNGQPLSRHNLANRIWRPTLKALGLRHRRPYQTRHTAATLWLAAGEAPEWIAKQMGHTSTKMLFTVYSRFVPNLTRKDGSMFELLVGSRFACGTAPAQPEAGTHGD